MNDYSSVYTKVVAAMKTCIKKVGINTGKVHTFSNERELLDYYRKICGDFGKEFDYAFMSDQYVQNRRRTLTPTYPSTVVLSPLAQHLFGAKSFKTGSSITQAEYNMIKKVKDIIYRNYGDPVKSSAYIDEEGKLSYFQGNELINSLGRCQTFSEQEGQATGKERFDDYGADQDLGPKLTNTEINFAVQQILIYLGNMSMKAYSEPSLIGSDTFKKVSGVGEPYNTSSKNFVKYKQQEITAKYASFYLAKDMLRIKNKGYYNPANLGIIPSPGAKGDFEGALTKDTMPMGFISNPRTIFMAGRVTTDICARLARPIIDRLADKDQKYINYGLAYYGNDERASKLRVGKEDVEKIYLANKILNAQGVNIDFSRGDQTNRFGLMALSFTALLISCNDPTTQKEMFNNMLLTLVQPVVYRSKDGRYHLRGKIGTVSSGIVGTQLIGSLDNIAANAIILPRINPKYKVLILKCNGQNKPGIQVLGDDVIVLMISYTDLEKYAEVAAKLGLKVNASKSQFGFMFLKQYIKDNEKGNHFEYPLARIARSLLYRRFSTAMGPNQGLLSQMTIGQNGRYTPGADELFKYLQQYDKLGFGKVYNYNTKLFLQALKQELNEVRNSHKKFEKMTDSEILNFDNPNVNIDLFNKDGSLKESYITNTFKLFSTGSNA